MMHPSVYDLSARLPELAWKLGTLYRFIPTHVLPKDLFQSHVEITPDRCIAEIKADLEELSQRQQDRSTNYMARRIEQKINVLVRLCLIKATKKQPLQQQTFGVEKISTRQQWLQSLQKNIEDLTEQQQALLFSVAQSKGQKNSDIQLRLQQELGEIERRLTLAKEAQAKSTLY